MAAPDRTRRKKGLDSTSVNWTAVSAIIGVFALAVAVGFNALQAMSSADADHQSQLATELGLLTQLQSVTSRSVYNRTRYTKQFEELRDGRRSGLTRPAYRATAEEAATLDYVAWLFDNGYVDTGRADELWGPRMLCEYRQAFAPALKDPAHDLPNLLEFIQQRGHRLSPLVERC
ncbi:MAG: hypothetical protein JST59_23195 [Actinobacteria bacterium]|nr:hypothetical protein [Actinomycetota bacterium]